MIDPIKGSNSIPLALRARVATGRPPPAGGCQARPVGCGSHQFRVPPAKSGAPAWPTLVHFGRINSAFRARAAAAPSPARAVVCGVHAAATWIVHGSGWWPAFPWLRIVALPNFCYMLYNFQNCYTRHPNKASGAYITCYIAFCMLHNRRWNTKSVHSCVLAITKWQNISITDAETTGSVALIQLHWSSCLWIISPFLQLW